MWTNLSAILSQLKDLGYSFFGEVHNDLIPYDPLKFDPMIQFNMFAIVKQ